MFNNSLLNMISAEEEDHLVEEEGHLPQEEGHICCKERTNSWWKSVFKSYAVAFKMQVIKVPKEKSNRAAAKQFHVAAKRVREWQKQEDQLLGTSRKSRLDSGAWLKTSNCRDRGRATPVDSTVSIRQAQSD